MASPQSFTGANLSTATRLAPGSPANLNRFDAVGKLIATCIRGGRVAREDENKRARHHGKPF